MKKKIFFIGVFILTIVGIVYSDRFVEAATKVKVRVDDPKIRVCFNKETGAYINVKKDGSKCASGNGGDVVKYIDNDYAYCVNWELEFLNHDAYVLDESWKKSSKEAIMAGFIMNEVSKKGYDMAKSYARTGAALNTFFATVVNDTGSYDFSKDSEISSYINAAKKYYATVEIGNRTPKVNIDVADESDIVLNYKGTNGTDGYYYSNKITISGLVKSFGGSDSLVNYSISAKTKSGVVLDICKNDKRQDCETNISLKGVEASSQSYYLFVDADKVDSTDVITFEVKSSNESKYFSSELYKDSINANAQRVIRISEHIVSRSNLNSYQFSIPNLVGHRISAYKVDEDGNEVCGATLEIYRDDPTGANVSNRVAINNNDDDDDICRVTYVTDSTAEGADDFFNHDYYLIERNAPDGFVLVDNVKHFYKKDSLDGNGGQTLTCVNSNGESVDPEYCYPEYYKFMCRSNSDPSILEDIDEETGNCRTDSSGTSGPTLNGEGNDETAITPNAIPEQGNVDINALFSKVCYYVKDENNIVEAKDASYCNSDDNYTKIWTGNGNIAVRQLNVRNVVNISKMDIKGEKEVIGAHLKVCTKASYDADGNNCAAATTRDGIVMDWFSDDVPYSIYGIIAGEYYIVESVPPVGYLKATTAVKFSIDKYGNVITDNKTITNDDFVNKGGVIVIDNKITNIIISKRDKDTFKELPGATISICQSYPGENGEPLMKVNQYTGECIEAVLAGGKIATWKSTDKEKEIEGLAPGTYFLAEIEAPTDYILAEPIIFTLKDDGSLVDKDGKPFVDNRIIMFDEPFENEDTGLLDNYLVIGIGFGVVVIGIGTYYYLNRTKVNDMVKNIFKRKNKVDKD